MKYLCLCVVQMDKSGKTYGANPLFTKIVVQNAETRLSPC